MLVALAIGYFLDTSGQLTQLGSLEKKEANLKQILNIKQGHAANLTTYKKQLKEIEKTFGDLLNQLPSRNEVADLLTDITQTGLSNNLVFDLFKPMPEQPKEFYAELPINIKVRGDYHDFGKFISGVAALPRIVTVNNFKITTLPAEQKAKNPKKYYLSMEAQAKTYRYLDEKELSKLGSKKSGKKK